MQYILEPPDLVTLVVTCATLRPPLTFCNIDHSTRRKWNRPRLGGGPGSVVCVQGLPSLAGLTLVVVLEVAQVRFSKFPNVVVNVFKV